MKRLIICCVTFIVVGCVQKQEEKIVQKDKKEVIEESKGKLIEIIYPDNLLTGNTPEEMIDFYKQNTDENTPKGAISIKKQMSDYYINEKGLLVQCFTEKQLNKKRELVKESALMKADFYKDLAIKKVEFQNKDLTHANIYVIKSEYDGGAYESTNEKSRILVKIYITTYMGAYQIYSGVNPNEWKVHLNIYDVDTKELLHEYDYPTEEFPNIKI